MTSSIPGSHQDLLRDEARAFAFLATTMPDGSPQLTPVWFDTSGDHLRVNTAEGRTKWRNMKARPRIALTILDPKNDYRYVQVRGKVVGWTTEGAREHIDRLARKYHDAESYGGPRDEQRVIFTIQPEAVDAHG